MALHAEITIELVVGDAHVDLIAERIGVALRIGGRADASALVRILPGWRMQEVALHLVFPPRKHVLTRVRAFCRLRGRALLGPALELRQHQAFARACAVARRGGSVSARVHRRADSPARFS